jgi:protein-S-isoprenylcysteine O-methyltransferase Ste14
VSRLLIFAGLTAVLAYVSREPLRLPRSHGFVRFFAWECIVALVLLNFVSLRLWFADPFCARQLVSWFLLIASIVPAALGGLQLLGEGRPSPERPDDPSLFAFEKTTQLVTTGMYRYVRHPLYGSLLLLAWGVFWKRPSWVGTGLALAATGFLVATAKAEEGENLRYFGAEYRAYQRATKLFIPYLF